MPNNERARNDSVLNTGMTSAVERRRLKVQEELHKKREAKRVELTPQGDTILSWIEAERKEAADITKMILNLDSEENVRAQLLARQMHIKFLDDAKTRVKKYLREPNKKDERLEFGNG